MRAIVRSNPSARVSAQWPFIIAALTSILVAHCLVMPLHADFHAPFASAIAILAIYISSCSWQAREAALLRTLSSVASTYLSFRYACGLSFHPTPVLLTLTPLLGLAPWPPTPRCFTQSHATVSPSCACGLTYATAVMLSVGSVCGVVNTSRGSFRESVAAVAGATSGLCFLGVASGALSSRKLGLDGDAERFAAALLPIAALLLSDRVAARSVAIVSSSVVIVCWKRVSSSV